MRVNVKTEIVDYDNNAIVQGITKDEKTGVETKILMTIGGMMINALNQPPQEPDKNLPAEKKIARATLSQEIHNAMKDGSKGFVDLQSEQVTELKGLLNSFYQPLPLMRAFDIIDPQPKEVKKAK